jgi:hypothetical protein
MLPDKSIVTNRDAGQCERATPFGRVGILDEPSLRRLPMFRQCARADTLAHERVSRIAIINATFARGSAPRD